MYARFFKRILDFLLSLFALVVLFPVLLILMILGFIFMKGNPFFTQLRPGKDEKIFRLIKFRTMTNQKDKDGNLLPDNVRLTKYGKFLRNTSLDELPEVINILKGDMSVVGPRPLVVKYLPFYTEFERERHTVRPGLTGLAQVNGRNSLKWEDKFKYDVKYVHKLTLACDVGIIIKTIRTVLKREDIGVRGAETLMDFDIYRKKQMEDTNVR